MLLDNAALKIMEGMGNETNNTINIRRNIMFCTNCGAKASSEGVAFCTNCGSPISAVGPAADATEVFPLEQQLGDNRILGGNAYAESPPLQGEPYSAATPQVGYSEIPSQGGYSETPPQGTHAAPPPQATYAATLAQAPEKKENLLLPIIVLALIAIACAFAVWHVYFRAW